MVALKLGSPAVAAAEPCGKQERRGGIETNLLGPIMMKATPKQERRGGIETLRLRLVHEGEAAKQERRGGIET